MFLESHKRVRKKTDVIRFTPYQKSSNVYSFQNMIRIKDKNIVHLIEITNIIYCQSKGNYSSITAKDVYKSLKNIQSLITNQDSSLFFRCHKSFLVNISCISEIDIKSNELHLYNGTNLPVAKSKKKGLERALNDFLNDNHD